MNCPQCQERLDERLDEMRPAMRSGALTSEAARAQARTAFDAIVSDCPECETDLRTYLQLRLSLMTPDAEMAAVEVPPNIRLNVRRALEREPLSPPPSPPPRSAWNPLKGFVWTGGAIVSAVALFVIARPFLLESAQKPLPASSSGTPPVAIVGRRAPTTTGVAPVTMPPKQAPRPPMGISKSASKPRGAVTAAPSTAGSSSSFLELSPPQITSNSASPKVRKPASSATGGSRKSGGPKFSPREARMMQKPSEPEPALPMVGSPGPGFGGPGKVSPSFPSEPRLDPKLLAPSGKELGLSVQFVPSAPAGIVRHQVRSAAPPSAFRPAPKKLPESPINPEALEPPTSPKNPAQSSDTTSEKPSGGAGGTAGSAGPAAPVPAPAIIKGNLSVSVKKEVVNARVVGQIKGAAPKETILWSGKASAGQSIPVPLEPLGAVKGDTIIVSFQQQVSLGETKTLATESVVVP